jgi:predicted nucleic acid-binding protein
VNCYFLDSTAFIKLFVQEAGTDSVIRLMEATEDNRKLISAGTPLEVYAALKRRERSGGIAAEDSEAARTILRIEAARMVQQPLNPAVLEAARQVIDHHELRSTEALQLGAAIVAREMFQGLGVVFVSSDEKLLEAARGEHFETLNPLKESANELGSHASDNS